MTFSAEQRRGKQGENDTRFAVDFTRNLAAQCRNSLTRTKSLHGAALQAAVMIWWIATTTSFWNTAKKELVRLTPDRPRDREVRRSEIIGFVATNQICPERL